MKLFFFFFFLINRWENKRESPKIVIEEPKETTDNIVVERSNSPIAKLKGEINESPNPGRKENKFRKDKYKIGKDNNNDHKDKKSKEKQQKSSSERIIIGGEESSRIENNNFNNSMKNGRLPREIVDQFEGKSREVTMLNQFFIQFVLLCTNRLMCDL